MYSGEASLTPAALWPCGIHGLGGFLESEVTGHGWQELVPWLHVLGVHGNKSRHVTGRTCRGGGGPRLRGVSEEGSLLGAQGCPGSSGASMDKQQFHMVRVQSALGEVHRPA